MIRKLNIKPIADGGDVQVRTVMGSKKYNRTKIVQIGAAPLESGETISLRCRVMKNLPQCSYQNIVALKKKHKYLQDVPLKTTEARRVGLIIGRDRTDLLEMEDKVIGKEGEPKAYKFKLGWAVMVPKKQQGKVEMLTTEIEDEPEPEPIDKPKILSRCGKLNENEFENGNEPESELEDKDESRFYVGQLDVESKLLGKMSDMDPNPTEPGPNTDMDVWMVSNFDGATKMRVRKVSVCKRKSLRVMNDNGKSNKKKKKIPVHRNNCMDWQLEELKREFQDCNYPSYVKSKDIARKLNLKYHQVYKWFKNERWRKRTEIMPSLWPGQKWIKENRNFKVGDEVLEVDKNLPAYRWNIGRVTATYSGRDGVVGIVDVRMENGDIITKAVHRLVLLF